MIITVVCLCATELKGGKLETGKKIKILRLLSGSGQLELAKGLGMKAATHVNRWEQGGAMPRANMLQRLGDYLEVCWPWLYDSNSDFSKESYVNFRPLSPYVPYTARWLSLLQREIAELLPELFQELHIQNVWSFSAPCSGGLIVAAKPGLTMLISCLPELYDSLEKALPSVRRVEISDSDYAEQLFLGTLSQDLFKHCGIDYVDQKRRTVPSTTNVNVRIKASAAGSIDHMALKKYIQGQIETIITDAGLLEADVFIDVTASRNSSEIVLDLVSDPALKHLAIQLNDPIE